MNKLEKIRALELQAKVCERAERECPTGDNRITMMMDLDSVPELDLRALLDAPAIDFAHDIHGIRRHMDRSTYPGKLTGCFVPRYVRA